MFDFPPFTNDDSEVPPSLREHFFRHNLTALGLAALTLIGAAFFWGVLYAAAYWVTLLAVGIMYDVETGVPRFFPLLFIITALALCLVGAALRWLWPNELVTDRKPYWEIFADFVLVVPRMTLAIWGNVSACRPLSRSDMTLAWQLLQKIVAVGKLNIQSVAVEIPEARTRDKIVLALQITDLVYLKKTDDDFFLVINGKKARDLTTQKVRIKVEKRPRQERIEN